MNEENTQELATHLANSKRKIKAYHDKYPDTVQNIRDDNKPQSLPGCYTAQMLYGWNDGKFKKEYLAKLECSWNQWKKGPLLDHGHLESDP